jgi:SAM-dependent methyltransferase
VEDLVSWHEFWDGETPIYVNERHKLLHYRLVASGIIEAMAQLPDASPGKAPGPVVLDHGCGEALSAQDVAGRCERLYLCEAAASLRQKLAARFAATGNVVVVSPIEVADIAAASLDLVVANSLVQYLTAPEFASALRLWRHALKPKGVLLLADVLPKGLSPLTDALALLRFGWQAGFLLAAMGGLVRTALSDYRKLRAELGLASYEEKEMIAPLAEAGFVARRRYPNLGHNQARMAFLAKPG